MAFIEGEDRYQINLLPNTLDDFVSEDNPVRVIDAYIDSLDLEELGFIVHSGNKAGQKPYKRKDLLVHGGNIWAMFPLEKRIVF